MSTISSNPVIQFIAANFNGHVLLDDELDQSAIGIRQKSSDLKGWAIRIHHCIRSAEIVIHLYFDPMDQDEFIDPSLKGSPPTPSQMPFGYTLRGRKTSIYPMICHSFAYSTPSELRRQIKRFAKVVNDHFFHAVTEEGHHDWETMMIYRYGHSSPLASRHMSLKSYPLGEGAKILEPTRQVSITRLVKLYDLQIHLSIRLDPFTGSILVYSSGYPKTLIGALDDVDKVKESGWMFGLDACLTSYGMRSPAENGGKISFTLGTDRLDTRLLLTDAVLEHVIWTIRLLLSKYY